MATQAPAPAPAAGGSKKKLIILIVLGALALVGAAAGTTWFLVGGKAEKAAVAKQDANAEDGGENADGEEDAAAEEGDGEASDEEAAAEEGGGGHGGEGDKKPSPYVPLEPAFVVNFIDEKKRTKFLKAEISLLAKSPKTQAAIKEHAPAVRNALVMLLSKQVYEQLVTAEGKDKLRADALAEVQGVLAKVASKKVAKGVTDLYFSSLVMQ